VSTSSGPLSTSDPDSSSKSSFFDPPTPIGFGALRYGAATVKTNKPTQASEGARDTPPTRQESVTEHGTARSGSRRKARLNTAPGVTRRSLREWRPGRWGCRTTMSNPKSYEA
jgi:hypothetical protein